MRVRVPPSVPVQLPNIYQAMSYISGSRKALIAMLQDAFECGFEAGFHCEDNPGDPHADWLDYYSTSLDQDLGLTDDEE